jgi:hypothetical protein
MITLGKLFQIHTSSSTTKHFVSAQESISVLALGLGPNSISIFICIFTFNVNKAVVWLPHLSNKMSVLGQVVWMIHHIDHETIVAEKI